MSINGQHSDLVESVALVNLEIQDFATRQCNDNLEEHAVGDKCTASSNSLSSRFSCLSLVRSSCYDALLTRHPPPQVEIELDCLAMSGFTENRARLFSVATSGGCP